MLRDVLLDLENRHHAFATWMILSGWSEALITFLALGAAWVAFVFAAVPRMQRWQAARTEAILAEAQALGEANRHARIAANLTGRRTAVCPSCYAVLIEGLDSEHAEGCKRPAPRRWLEPPSTRYPNLHLEDQ